MAASIILPLAGKLVCMDLDVALPGVEHLSASRLDRRLWWISYQGETLKLSAPVFSFRIQYQAFHPLTPETLTVHLLPHLISATASWTACSGTP